MPDNMDIYYAYERDREKELESLPLCCMCGEHIQQEDAVHLNGEWFCDDCLKDSREEIYADL